MLNKTVGLYIGDRTIEVVEAERLLKGLKITKWATLKAPDDIKALTKEQKLSLFKEVLAKAGIKNPSINISLPPDDVLVRYFPMPSLPKANWDQAIKFESKKYIPFKLDEIAYSFQVFPEKEEKKGMKVVFASVRKDVVKEYLDLLAQLKLKTSTIDSLPLNLINVFNFTGQIKKDEVAAIIYIEEEKATIEIVKGNVFYFTRAVSLKDIMPAVPVPQPAPVPPPALEPTPPQTSGPTPISDIVAGPGTPKTSEPGGAQDAPPVLQGPAVPVSPQADPAPVQQSPQAQVPIPAPPPVDEIEERISAILSDVNLSFGYFRKEFKGEEIRKVLLCGKGDLSRYAQAFGKELELPVEMGKLKGKIAAKDEAALDLYGAIGSALRAWFAFPAVTLNLGPVSPIAKEAGELLPKLKSMDPKAVGIAGGIVALLIILIVHFATAGQLKSLRKEYNKRSEEFAMVENMNLEALTAELAGTTKTIATVRSLTEPIAGLSDKLIELAHLLPEGAWITRTSFTVKDIKGERKVLLKVTGKAYSADESPLAVINRLSGDLENSSSFSKGFTALEVGKLSKEQMNERTVANFELSFTN